MHIEDVSNQKNVLLSFKGVFEVYPILNIDQYLQDLVLPDTLVIIECINSDPCYICVHFSELSLDSRFVSSNKKKMKSILHLEVIES